MRALRAGVCLFVFALLAYGQGDRGSITGTVTDPGGAVVAGAVIEARNPGSGALFPTQTTATGNYTIPQLPVGTYEVAVTVAGFKKYVRQNIVVQGAETVRVDIGLEVGAATDSVTVTSEVSLLKTESGELSQHIDKVDELPVFGVGPNAAGSSGIRNPLAMTTMLPGTYWAPNSDVRVNGAPSNSQSMRIEGQEASNGYNMNAQGQTQAGVETIQELSVQTSNYSAEFGQAGGGVFNFTIKSGTNQFHGSAYDYWENDRFNASQAFPNIKPPQNRNDFGFSLGGPVRIPKVYNGRDKTFFFVSWEDFREYTTVNNNAITVPTAAYRAGNFSQTNPKALGTDILGRPILDGEIYDPGTTRTLASGQIVRDPYPNQQIPLSQLDPVALKVQALIPLATGTGLVNNFIPAYESDRITGIPLVKIDQTIGSKQKISFYWSKTRTTGAYSPQNGNSEGLPGYISAARGTFIGSYTMRANYDYTVTPTLLAHVGLGFIRNHFFDEAPASYEKPFDAVAEFGFKLSSPRNFPQFLGPTSVGSTLCSNAGSAANTCSGFGGMQQIGPGGQIDQFWHRPTANVNLTWVKGSHTFKAGGELRIEGFPGTIYNGSGDSSGLFRFSPAETGLPYLQSSSLNGGTVGFTYASFLLGNVDAGNQSVPTTLRTGKHELGLFLQDTWKVTRKLTMDYGLRWDYETYLKEQYGRFPSFSPTVINSQTGTPGAVVYEATCKCSFSKNYPYAIGPRLGIAYQITPKTVFRGGFGVVYGNTAQGGSLAVAASQNPYATSSFGIPVMNLGKYNIPLTAQQIAWPNFSSGQYPLPGQLSGPPVVVDPNAGRPARQVMWSAGFQREILPNLVVEASYVGNRGVWWQANGLVDYNALTPQALAARGLSLNNSADLALLSSTVGSQAAISRGFNSVPYPGFPTTATVAQSLRPFPQFNTGLSPLWAPLGNTWYDSLQAKVNKRLSHGLDLQYSFSWQKELTLGAEADTTGPQSLQASVTDVFNRGVNKAISAYSRPLVSVFNINYTVPKFGGNKWLSYAAKDWGISIVATYGSGLPIHSPFAQNNLVTTQLLRDYTVANSNPSGNTGNLMNRVPGVPLFQKDLNGGGINPTTDLVLNPAAWSSPGPGQWGTAAPYYNDFRYQRRPTENVGFSRTFRIRERMSAQIRMEFSNILNRTEALNPVGTNALAPTTRSANGTLTGGFGFIATNTVYAQPRQGTMVLRFQF